MNVLVFTVGRVCKESIGNFYLGGDVMRWSDCMKYLGVHFKCAQSRDVVKTSSGKTKTKIKTVDLKTKTKMHTVIRALWGA